MASSQSHIDVEKKMFQLNKKFRASGIINGLISGLTYGIYSTFVAVASGYDPLSTTVGLFSAPFVCSGLNDLFSGLWLLLYNAKQGKLKELSRTLKTKSGMMMVLGFLLGGPIANGAYLIGIAMAGAYAIPVSATCGLFGALFSWLFFKQKPTKRVWLGMAICIVGAGIIGWSQVDNAPNFTLGIIFSLIAAIGWGLEGMFSSFGGAMLDTDVAVNLRQLISGIVVIGVILPILNAFGLLTATLVAGIPAIWLIISGLTAAVSFLCWYKANAMVGCAVGMSLNVTYAFWGVILSVIFLGQELTTNIVIGSIAIVIGAILVTMNPLDFLKKGVE
ncbi:DMT family transporter [Carnobacteriaceae bacterium zg-ZUI78]|nr:DMT family transporter [Carnobacteriaceae bacterium zg-ZUI78]